MDLQKKVNSIFIYFSICIFVLTSAQALLADQPLLSSKAIRIAIKAKESIQSPDKNLISEAVFSLESILQDPSFLRLDPAAQVDILFLLSRCYERLERFTDQEKFLLSYARRRELFRYRVPLKTALIRSYIHQDRIFEAEHLLSKLAKPSLFSSSLEEKIEIAKTIIFTEDTLRGILLSAEELILKGSFHDSLKKYKTVLSSLEKYYFPFQASPVEKIRLQYSLVLRIAELYFLLGDYQHTSLVLSNWPEATSESPGTSFFFLRRSILLALTNARLNKKLESKEELLVLQENENTSLESLSWKAYEAISNNNLLSLTSSIQALEEKKREDLTPLIHILKGFKEALSNNAYDSYIELEKGTSIQNQWTLPWKEAALSLFADIGLQRATVLSLSLQEEESINLRHKIAQRIENSTHPDILAKIDKLLNFSASTQLESKNPTSWPITTPPLSLYVNSLFSYNKALGDASTEEEALLTIENAYRSLPDAKPQLLCFTIDLLLRGGRLQEACHAATSLLQEYPEYALTQESILLCLQAIESSPEYEKDFQLFQSYLFSSKLSPQAILLTFQKHEMKKNLPENAPKDIKNIYYSLTLRDDALKFLLEASKSKEAGYIKERVEKAHSSFNEAAKLILDFLPPSSCKPERNTLSTQVLLAHLLSLYCEQLDSLEKALLSPFAFNELSSLITETADSLHQTLFSQKEHICESSLDPLFLKECSSYSATAPLYAYTFTRDFDKAINLVNTFTESMFRTSKCTCRGILFAAKGLRESHRAEEASLLLSHIDETVIKDIQYELALEVAIEKSLCYREMKQIKRAMALLGWVINSPCVSSLRIKAMVVRADLYIATNREELAIKQLESVVRKGGEWGAVAERKLRTIQKDYGSS